MGFSQKAISCVSDISLVSFSRISWRGGTRIVRQWRTWRSILVWRHHLPRPWTWETQTRFRILHWRIHFGSWENQRGQNQYVPLRLHSMRESSLWSLDYVERVQILFTLLCRPQTSDTWRAQSASWESQRLGPSSRILWVREEVSWSDETEPTQIPIY